MYDPITGVIGATLLGGGLGLWGASKQADAATQAADIQAQAAREAAASQVQQYQQTRSDLQPWVSSGRNALQQLQGLTGSGGKLMQGFGITPTQEFQKLTQPYAVNASDFLKAIQTSSLPSTSSEFNKLTRPFQFSSSDPSYQWRLNQGLEALNKSAAARGGYFSGQTGKDITDYAQGLASTEFQNAFQRDQAQKALEASQYQNLYGLDLSKSQLNLSQLKDALNAEMGQRELESGQYGQAFGQDLSQRQNIYNMLSGLSDVGRSAASQTGQWGMQNVGTLSDLTGQAAQAQAGGLLGQANAWYGGMQNLSDQLQSGLGLGLKYSMLGQNNYWQ
jgi:hypothetical protein